MGATSTYLAEECSEAARVGCGVLSRWPWLVCAVISFIQLKMIRSATSPCDFSYVGFCVTNFDKDATPNCPRWRNSQTWALFVGLPFAALIWAVKDRAPAPRAHPLIAVGSVAVVLAHALLHGLLGLGFPHLMPPCMPYPGLTPTYELVRDVVYLPFLFLLCYFTCRLAGRLEPEVAVIVAVVYVHFLYGLNFPTKDDMNISVNFPGLQLLAALLAALRPNPLLNNWLGVWFILPCVVGVCEVTFCCDGAADQAGWYCELGGHALYDVALNLVFLGLQYVTPGESVASRTRSKKSA